MKRFTIPVPVYVDVMYTCYVRSLYSVVALCGAVAVHLETYARSILVALNITYTPFLRCIVL